MKAKNLWRKIVDAVKRLFGIKADGAEETTAYKEVSAALDKMLETFDEGLYQQYVGKKSTAFTGRTGQLSTDSTSGSLVQSATHSPADTLGVSFDAAKVRNFSQKARNNINNFKNGDNPIIAPQLETAFANLRKFFAMNYSGRSNYVVYDTPKGRMAFRLTDHNAFGKNFERDKAKQVPYYGYWGDEKELAALGIYFCY